MQITVELPDTLAKKLEDYLQDHPEETIPNLVQAALEAKLIPKETLALLAPVKTAHDVSHDDPSHQDHSQKDIAHNVTPFSVDFID